MPSSAVRTFSDPDDYTASIRGTSAEMTVIGRGHFEAKLTQIELHRLRMQRFYDNLPRVAHSAAVTGRAIVNFRIRPGPSMLANGVELKPTSIMRHSDGLDAFQRSSGCAYWGSISLPVEAVASAGATLGGCDLAPPKDPLTVTPTLARWQSSSGCTPRRESWRKTLPKSSPITKRHTVSNRR